MIYKNTQEIIDENKSLKDENKSLKNANNLLRSKEGNVITKNKIKSIIKEVDSCINLITDIN